MCSSNAFYRALPLAACFGAGSLYGWSGYARVVEAQFQSSKAATSMVFSVALASFTLGVLLCPLVMTRITFRYRLPLLTACAAICMAIASSCTGFEGFLLAYGLGFGVAAGMIYSFAVADAASGALAGFLVPVTVAAFGLGGAAMGPLTTVLAEGGWGLWASLPVQICLLMVTTLSLIFSEPEAEPADDKAPAMRFAKPDLTVLKLWAIFATGSWTGLMVIGLAAQIILTQTAEANHLAWAVFSVAVGNTIGRLGAALSAPALGPSRALVLALALSMISVVMLMSAATVAVLFAALFLVAFCYGHVAANVPLLVRAHVSEAAFASAYGWVFTGWGFAGLTAPWMAGALLDATGSLSAMLVISLCMTVGCVALILRYFPHRGVSSSSRIRSTR